MGRSGMMGDGAGWKKWNGVANSATRNGRHFIVRFFIVRVLFWGQRNADFGSAITDELVVGINRWGLAACLVDFDTGIVGDGADAVADQGFERVQQLVGILRGIWTQLFTKHNSYIFCQRYSNDWTVSFINLKGLCGFQCLDDIFASIRSRG